MEDGLMTLLFILFLVVASIMDAVGRHRKKQRRMEEMEAEDGAGEASPGVEGYRDRSEPAGADRTRRVGQGDPARAGSGERETAETMVPEDFWAILTGQEPERRPPPEPKRDDMREPGTGNAYGEDGREAAQPGDLFGRDDLGRRGDPDPPKEPRIPTPVPGDRVSTDPSRSGREPDDVPQWGKRRKVEPRETGAIGDEEAQVYAQPAEPWGDLADIAAGDLTDEPEGEVHGTTSPGAFRRAPALRRGSGRGRYTRLLETGDLEDLRKAVVLREVLDRPVGFRDDVGPDW